jgi:hypothetical protein
MSTVIGLAVASDELRALLVRDGVVHWAGCAGRKDDTALSVQVAALLAQAPVRRWPRPRVMSAVGPSAAQMKRLQGLPPVTDPAALARIVREGAGRFFLRNGIPLDTSGARVTEPGAAWAAAFERPVVSQIELGCKAARFRLRAIVPTVAALANVFGTVRGVWRDGEARAEFEAAGGVLLAVRRLADGAGNDAPLSTPASLASLGADGWRFADAYGAALTPESEPVAIRPLGTDGAAVSRRRITTAAAACAVAGALALFAPGIVATVDHARVSRELATLGPHARDAAAIAQELRRVSRALSEVNAFAASRRAPTELLAGLARRLPAGTALITLRVDSAGGTLVLLAPRAARAIAALDSVPGIDSPEVVGPVTREVSGTRELERATVRFRLSAEAPQ